MDTANKICLIAILILSWACFVEEFANFYFLYRGDRTRFRVWVFFAIGMMDAFLTVEYFFFR